MGSLPGKHVLAPAPLASRRAGGQMHNRERQPQVPPKIIPIGANS
jgi:hypothetical protein